MDRLDEATIEQFHDSLDRCGSTSQFLGRFYQIFSASSPEVAARFSDTNFKTQTRALKTSFYMAMLASDKNTEASDYLERIAIRHNHKQLDIKPEFYILWLDSMIKAVSEFDPQFNNEVEQAWRRFMQPAIEFMMSRYES
ncbi:MAG: globin [Oceanicoccus sp.]|uniref:globin n=1 Tax=Oceanicoccus sp. TaxID=2691044 RepID=UPI002615B34A|nr:globin [Oceanicoccus sp.]MCP3908512.1 globin [Oceanicoccus sp.]